MRFSHSKSKAKVDPVHALGLLIYIYLMSCLIFKKDMVNVYMLQYIYKQALICQIHYWQYACLIMSLCTLPETLLAWNFTAWGSPKQSRK